MNAFRTLTLSSSRRGLGAAVCVVVMIVSGCSESGDDVEAAQERVTQAEEALADAGADLEQAGEAFCDEAMDYITAIDRYGKVFDDQAATVGDVTTLGADLGEPRDSTVDAAQAVLDAHDAVNDANGELAEARGALADAKASASGKPEKEETSPSPPPSEPSVAEASVERVKAAEEDLEAASKGITDETPLMEATEEFTSAAFALEVAWINLFTEAGCLADEEASEAAAALSEYTISVQTDLKTGGYLEGEVDGVYGPETVAAVEALQADADLPVTGVVDLATRAALDDALARQDQTASTNELVAASSIQTALKLAGYWPGAIDGQWTPELEAALKEFQKDLGIEPTGAVDAATLAALEDLLVTIQTQPAATPTPSPAP